MGAGKRKQQATILRLNADLRADRIGPAWCSIRSQEGAGVSEATGLRSPAKVTIRCKWTASLVNGRYLRHGDRLFHLVDVRDPVGTRRDLVISADELIGEWGEFRPENGAPVRCRALLHHEAPFYDDQGQVTDYRTAAEVALIEVGRVQEGDELVVSGERYSVIGYRNETDDGVVRGIWLERI